LKMVTAIKKSTWARPGPTRDVFSPVQRRFLGARAVVHGPRGVVEKIFDIGPFDVNPYGNWILFELPIPKLLSVCKMVTATKSSHMGTLRRFQFDWMRWEAVYRTKSGQFNGKHPLN
jgi:hypothetical protein